MDWQINLLLTTLALVAISALVFGIISVIQKAKEVTFLVSIGNRNDGTSSAVQWTPIGTIDARSSAELLLNLRHDHHLKAQVKEVGQSVFISIRKDDDSKQYTLDEICLIPIPQVEFEGVSNILALMK